MGLANAMADYADVTVIQPEALHPSCAALADPRLRIVSFPKPPFRRQVGNIPAVRHAFRLIRDSKPDVLHLQEACDYAVDLFNTFMPLPPLVTTIHDVTPHPGDGHAAPGLQYSKAPSIWRARRVIVHTSGMKDRLSERFRVRPEKIDVIPHGELGSLYKALGEKAGREQPPRDPYTMLFFGRIWPYKGLRYLLEAFAIVKEAIPEAKLIIAGKGGDLDANSRLIESMKGIEVIKNFIPDEDVANLYQRSSVVVLPYIEASQSGVSAVGFTLGSVVVASRVGGLGDSIQDHGNGVLVEPRNPQALASALVQVLQDPQALEAIRREAYQLGATKLSWTNIAKDTFNTYEKALAG
jgi:glycosyltransferase involved in cell wall biosynthesis